MFFKVGSIVYVQITEHFSVLFRRFLIDSFKECSICYQHGYLRVEEKRGHSYLNMSIAVDLPHLLGRRTRWRGLLSLRNSSIIWLLSIRRNSSALQSKPVAWVAISSFNITFGFDINAKCCLSVRYCKGFYRDAVFRVKGTSFRKSFTWLDWYTSRSLPHMAASWNKTTLNLKQDHCQPILVNNVDVELI